jgi:TRAP-type C4-dicarboxylate transport system permease small subunit
LIVLLFFVFSITFVLVFLRYVFNQSITGANEVVTILFIYTTAIGSAMSIDKIEHISIDIFISYLSSKNYKRIKTLQLVLLLFLHIIIFIYCLDWIKTAGGYLMPATGLPRIITIASIPTGCLLSILYCFNATKRLFTEVGVNNKNRT